MYILHTMKFWFQRVMNNVKAIEAAIIAALLWWALILFIPLDTFGQSPDYAAMAGIASEEVWSLVFFAVGVINLYGMMGERKLIRQIGLVMSNGLWVFVSAMLAYSNLATTGSGIYFIVACLNAYVVYKVGEQSGKTRC